MDHRAAARSTLVISMLSALLALPSCGEPEETAAPPKPTSTASPPKQPPLPSDVSSSGGTLFSLDTTTVDMSTAVRGVPSKYKIVGHLTSAGGQRALLLDGGSGATTEIAPGGWNLLPVGARDGSGNMLFCWNRLTGPESASGAMPHPTAGLALVCRYLPGGASLGPEIEVPADAVPSWLSDLKLETNGGFRVEYIRNQSGWLVGRAKPGDGLHARVFDGATLGPVQVMNAAAGSPSSGGGE